MVVILLLLLYSIHKTKQMAHCNSSLSNNMNKGYQIYYDLWKYLKRNK